ncbi:MAG: glycosyltransferase family 2 protein [Gammaproteobacteria bacterium]|nr:glycosyltransferase family 2 protein [Gammaproteobacteria bacterium]
MKVSVIITTYNRAQLVCEAIDSVLEQTYRDFELIVIDDGSSADTQQRLAAYGNRIHSVRQPNAGVNAARNTALALAQGEYIATLDDDDLWKPYKLALQVDILDRHPDLAFTYSNFSIYKNQDDIRPNGIQTWYARPMDWAAFFNTSTTLDAADLPAQTALYFGDIYTASLDHYFVLPSTALFRRSKIPAGVKFVEHDPICGDWDFFARLSRDHPVAYLDHDTTHNRSHQDAVRLTRTQWKRQLEFRVDLLERLYLQDAEFYRQHKTETDAVYRQRLSALCRQHILEGERQHAHRVLDKYRMHHRDADLHYVALRTAASVPGLGRLLKAIRR